MITGFLYNGDIKEAIEFFKRMPKRDAASLSALVSGLIQNDELDEAAALLFKYGKRGDMEKYLIHAYNTLIAGYGQKGRVEDAQRLFYQIPVCGNKGSGGDLRFERNVVSWNSMIMCYVKAGDIVSARKLFDLMEGRDTFSWNTMISGHVHVLNMDEAGDMELARNFFERMPQKSQLIIWGQVDAHATKWDLLKKRLMMAFPSCSSAFGISYYRAELQPPKSRDVILLKLSCHDRRGLLHGNFCILRVALVSCGPDTKMVVANPVELSGKGRPLVFYDIALAL
ncbi:unnamed protein product [Fraxinus pennsylvanica]|uniref:ACT domain-containing protein n=1 Tax=Fraxinus pennsylvanica TaxID=56036 RepID=A0AAD2DQD2_9LAMI|nr:unnamed protein product [Fraxinus pennsylvanica]